MSANKTFAVETRMINIGTNLPGRVLRKMLTKWPINPSIIQKFCARKLLVENFRVLRGFAKLLSFNLLGWIWRKIGIAGFKKSMPKKNLALPFYFLACFKTAKGHQIGAKNVHKTMACVQKSGFSPSAFHLAMVEQCSRMGVFRARLPRNREQILF